MIIIMKDFLKMKKHELMIKLRKPDVVIIGEEHGDLRAGVMTLRLLSKGYNIVAHEGLEEGRDLPERAKEYGRWLRLLEKTVFEAEKLLGTQGFAGLDNIAEHNLDEQISYLRQLNELLLQRASLEAERGNRRDIMEILRRRSAIRKLYTLLSKVKEDPFLANQYKFVLIGSRAPTKGIDSPRKEEVIEAFRERDKERMDEINRIRNEVMAKNIERLVREGKRVVAVVGNTHVDEIEKSLKERGIKVHSIRFGIGRPRTVKEYIERLVRSEDYFNELEKTLRE